MRPGARLILIFAKHSISSTYTQDALRQPSEPPPDLFSHNVCKLNAWNDVRLDFVSDLGLLLKGIR